MFNPLQLRLLLVVILPLITGCTESLHIVNQKDWPSPMADLLANYPGISKSIVAYQHNAFVDSKYAWKVNGQVDEIDALIRDRNLQSANTNHTKFKELERLLPSDWQLPKFGKSQIFASDGYGTKHQEGVDLLLLVRDTTKHETIILYEWIF